MRIIDTIVVVIVAGADSSMAVDRVGTVTVNGL
jgi:hypothetical protein